MIGWLISELKGAEGSGSGLILGITLVFTLMDSKTIKILRTEGFKTEI
jgi:hypothetical protein